MFASDQRSLSDWLVQLFIMCHRLRDIDWYDCGFHVINYQGLIDVIVDSFVISCEGQVDMIVDSVWKINLIVKSLSSAVKD